MKIWRLDAIHDAGDGSFTRFFDGGAHISSVDSRAGIWSRVGWLCDVYDEDVPGEIHLALILGGPWPVMPTEILIAIARRALEPTEVSDGSRADLSSDGDAPDFAEAACADSQSGPRV